MKSLHPKCSGAIARGEAYTVAGHGAESKSYKYQDWADAMGIDWMTKTELTQAVPPAYSRFIATEFSRVSLIGAKHTPFLDGNQSVETRRNGLLSNKPPGARYCE